MLVLLHDGCPVPVDVRPRDRFLVRLRASRLDGDLAAGESPDATVALSLRARMLVRMQTRRDLAAVRAARPGCRGAARAGSGPPAGSGLPGPDPGLLGGARDLIRRLLAARTRCPHRELPRPGPCSPTPPAPSITGPAPRTCAPGSAPRRMP